MPYEREMKGIKLLQDRASSIEMMHDQISSELCDLKKALMGLEGVDGVLESEKYIQLKKEAHEVLRQATPLSHTSLAAIYAEAENCYQKPVGLADILGIEGFAEAKKRVSKHVLNFNHHYGLDGWDYAIAGGCGLFAAMLDLLCVSPPLKPTVAFSQRVDGIFNQFVQQVFNKLIPPDLSKALSAANPIGAPDSSTIFDLIEAPDKALNPTNHRLRSLAHDPILGIIIGIWDMRHNTCTIVVDGKILSIPSTKDKMWPRIPSNAQVFSSAINSQPSIFQLIGRMFGHLLSDVNAPSGNGNRGMGLPAPFMALLRMLENIPVGDSSFGKQIEWMYVNGYDFRQFTATSMPMLIMEVLMRVFYVGKQMKKYGATFGETLCDTMPTRINPRFRMMLALAYGTSSAVNAGKMYVTGNILNANYASWMGFAWNGFHALKWSLLDKHLKLWEGIERAEIDRLEGLVLKLDELEKRAEQLPV